MKKILVPVDYSDTSIHALRLAAQLAVRADATLVLLHVNEMVPYLVPVSEYAYSSSTVDLDQYADVLEERIQATREELLADPQFANLQVETLVKEGLMTPTLTAVTEEEGVDLVVMSTLGASGWKEVLVGSNTERVIRHTNCPVLVIPEGVESLHFRKAVIPSTLKADQKLVFKMAKLWQDLFGFDVHALYINDPLNAPTLGTLETEKNRLAEAAGLRHVYLYVYGNTLSAESAIRGYAADAEADLIIMGTHQRQGLSHLLFGSVTEDTVNHTNLPVLVVPIPSL